MLRAWRAPRLEPGDTLTRTLRVLSNDLDLNGHMNDGRYLTIIDLMLVEYFVRTGFAGAMLRQGWQPMAGGSFITYRRALLPLRATPCDSGSTPLTRAGTTCAPSSCAKTESARPAT